MRQVYMDHSATTPVNPEVFEVMKPYYTDKFYNPSSIYSPSQEVKKAVEKAREQVADLLNASPEEIIFTSGGTEADNQAIISGAKANENKGKHIITSAIEHHAVLDTCLAMQKAGYEVTVLPVNPDGTVDPDVLKKALKPETVLVSIMHANNEVGTIQDIKTLAAIAHENGSVFHTDAVQSVGKIPVDVKDLGVDMLSVSAHKLYGPKGIGCLYVKKGVKIGSYLLGGGQENRLRAGTENVPGIVGLGKAAQLAVEEMDTAGQKLRHLEESLRNGIGKSIPHVRFTGHLSQRIPGHVSVCFDYVEGESILLMLDQVGIRASSGSACASGSLKASHVLLALGIPPETAHGSLRLTLGKDTTEEDVDYVLQFLAPIVERLRKMSPLTQKGGCSKCTQIK